MKTIKTLNQTKKPNLISNDKLTETLIKLFGGTVSFGNPSDDDFQTVNKLAVKLGYFVPKEVANTSVMRYLGSLDVNYNSTMYKTWSEIIEKTRFELYIDQLLHYRSTYGTGFTGKPYTQNDNTKKLSENEVLFSQMKVISHLTVHEVVERIQKLFYSGIALHANTIDDLFLILQEISDIKALDVDQIKNKEAKVKFIEITGSLPSDPFETLRYLVYKATGDAMLISNKKKLTQIKSVRIDLSKYLTSEKQLISLASIFLRFKNIILMFKGSKSNNRIINRLRKLANKHHKPFKIGINESILSFANKNTPLEKWNAAFKTFKSNLETTNNFKKVLLLNTILFRLKQTVSDTYIIRNGKSYTTAKKVEISDTRYQKVYSVVYKSLVDSLKEKATTVRLSEHINIALPTSEKNFIGNYPIGTKISTKHDNTIVGIYWENNWGARDLDLSLINIDVTKFGWNANFKNSNNSIVYSGDMTYADPSASEFFFSKNGEYRPSLIKVNTFSGLSNGVKFRLLVSSQSVNLTDARSNSNMIDLDKIIFNTDITTESKETIAGILTGSELILVKINNGAKIVSSYKQHDKDFINNMIMKSDSMVSLKSVLIDAGFTIVEDDNAEIDLLNPDKDTLISLLS